MKKALVIIFLFIFIIPTILSIDLEIKKVSSNEVLIKDLKKSTDFKLEITNKGSSDTFEIFNLAGLNTIPKKIFIASGETENLTVQVSPIGETPSDRFFTFPLFFKASDSTQTSFDLTLKIIQLENAFEVGADKITPNSESVEVFIFNRENFDFGEIKAKFSSQFFDFSKEFELGKNEKRVFRIDLDKEKFKELNAGFYTIKTVINIKEITAQINSTLEFSEINQVITNEKTTGFIIRKRTKELENVGNVPIISEVIIKKDIISRLFTHFNKEPDAVERIGGSVLYIWRLDLPPGQKEVITATTNWLFLLIIVIFIIAVVLIIKHLKKEDLVLRKNISFVRAKGGEFALKVNLTIKANSYIQNINIFDRVPKIAKIYHQFTGIEPERVDRDNNKIEWELPALEEGEKRTLSYIIYSKLGVLGRFALPKATTSYEINGKIKEIASNRAFFVSEQKRAKVENFE